MYRYALIDKQNKVVNIIETETHEFIDYIRNQYNIALYLDESNDDLKNAHIGYIWNGKTFYEDPRIKEQVENQNKSVITKTVEYIKSKLNPTEDEKKMIEEIEKGV